MDYGADNPLCDTVSRMNNKRESTGIVKNHLNLTPIVAIYCTWGVQDEYLIFRRQSRP